MNNESIVISRKRIRNIMKKYDLTSSYITSKYKPEKSRPNDEKISNIVDRDFSNRKPMEVLVSDLTYVKIGSEWNYICILLDLFNREIVGYSCGRKKDAKLVIEAFSTLKFPLDKIGIFHTDRGSEFKNKEIDNIIAVFNIRRSLSKKGSPYDNAVAEAGFKIIKTEFVKNKKFLNLKELKYKLNDYINWYNKRRIHGSLDNLTPKEYRIKHS